ncbi:MAG: class I SAM-dependent methyltransferase [Alphaproteobacteria bacterium]
MSDKNPAEVYEQYLGRFIADRFTRVLLKLAGPRPGERVLDLASGTGSVARHIAPLIGTEGRVVALDISPAMLAVGAAIPAAGGAGIEWLEGDALSLNFPDQAFDLILCQQGVQFFSDRKRALQEMRRVLAPGGRLSISVWQRLDRHPLYKALFQATARHLGASVSAFDVSFSLGDAEELRVLLAGAGFQRVTVTPQSLEIRLSSPELFVQLTVTGAATSVPAFAGMDASTRAALVNSVAHELDPVLHSSIQGEELIFPMHTHIAMAYQA